MRQFLADKTVADRTKRIFERTAINGESPEAVAESFKMTRAKTTAVWYNTGA